MSSKKKETNSKLYGILIIIVALVIFIALLCAKGLKNSDESNYSSGEERDYIAPVEIKTGFIPMTPLEAESGDLSRQ